MSYSFLVYGLSSTFVQAVAHGRPISKSVSQASHGDDLTERVQDAQAAHLLGRRHI